MIEIITYEMIWDAFLIVINAMLPIYVDIFLPIFLVYVVIKVLLKNIYKFEISIGNTERQAKRNSKKYKTIIKIFSSLQDITNTRN